MSLRLDHVTLTYPDGDERVVALDDVSLDVPAGELVAVTGPSGSGKSSLLAVAGLLIAPDSGTVSIGTGDVTALNPKQRTRIRRERLGFVFQQSNLIASLTATEQLVAVARLAGTDGRGTTARARDLLASLGLERQLDRRPHQLSGGQRQRVGIARALVNHPEMLLVDEPTSALDPERGRAIVELLATVTHEHRVATLMVTHDLAQLDLVDQHVEFHDGRLGLPRLAA
ncbi:MAG TPA: ABC transporter ATP-binding protein [Actinomycetales bacterium]|nr:ABC transporter ATP-binding protein [Actinomycetales bacterium]